MEPISPVSGTSEDRKEPVRKRKRTTLSCLQCVKRKAKCDKTHPCSTCISRKEAHLCEFEDGAAPAPAQASVSMDEFLALKSRLENLEHPARYTPTSLVSSPVASTYGRKDDLEVTLTSIEALAAGSGPGFLDRRVVSPATPMTPAPGPWPTITLPCPVYSGRSARWIRDMSEAYAQLPNPQTIRAIVDFFFEECLMTRIYVYPGLFKTELAEFEDMRMAGTQLKVDPAWAALLASVLWASLITMKNAPDSPISPHNCETMLASLAEVLDTFLACAEWVGRPQLRILFALVLTIPPHGPIPFTQRDPKWQGKAFRSMWFDVALSISKCLGIHLLGTDKPLPEDPMLPKHLPALARQICAQAFSALWLYDTFMFCGTSLYGGTIGTAMSSPFVIQDGSYDTAPMGNYREADLLTQAHPSPVSKYEITWDSLSIHKHSLGIHWRKIIEGLRNPELFTYEKVLKIDRDLRSAANVIENLVTGKQLDADESIIFDFLQSSYHFRLLRLHRPFFLQSFTDARFHFTKVAIVEAARTTTKANRRILTRHAHRPAVQHALYLCVHHLGALVVMFLHAQLDPRSRDEMRDEIRLSLDIMLEANAKNPVYFQRIGGRGIKAATIMLEALNGHEQVAPESVEQLVKDLLQETQAPDPLPSGADAFVMPTDIDLESLLKSWTSMQPQQTWLPESKMDLEIDWNNILRGF